MTKDILEKYISEMENAIEKYKSTGESTNIYSVLRRAITILSNEYNISQTDFDWRPYKALEDAKTLIDLLQYYIANADSTLPSTTTHTTSAFDSSITNAPLIFISHKSDDKKYGDALRNFITGLGVKDNQLIYTSHPLHKIPLNANIYDYLRSNIHTNIFMIILWSDRYLESPACLNEMGAAWVVQSDYTNVYVPDFHFGNPKYHECAVDTRKMGAVLNGDNHCKASMLELKDKIQAMFNLENDEQKTTYLLDNFVKEISNN